MVNNELLINPNTGEEYVNVPVKTAAAYLDFPYCALYEALKQGLAPFGMAVCPRNGKKMELFDSNRTIKSLRRREDLCARGTKEKTMTTYIQSILYLARVHIDKLITVAGAAITAVSIMLAIAHGDLYGGFWGVTVGTVITTIGAIMPQEKGDEKQ